MTRGRWLALALVAFAQSGAARANDTIEHVVQPGDTLWSIAGKGDVYDDPYLWPVIYEFNRDQISDPRRIYPRQVLQIPLQVGHDERREARDKAVAATAR